MDVDPGIAATKTYPAEIDRTVGAVLRDFALRESAPIAHVLPDAYIFAHAAICETVGLSDDELFARASELDAPPAPDDQVATEERSQSGSLRSHFTYWLERYGGADDPAAHQKALDALRLAVVERTFRLAYFQGQSTEDYRLSRLTAAFLASSALVTLATQQARQQLRYEQLQHETVGRHARASYAISGGAFAIKASNN